MTPTQIDALCKATDALYECDLAEGNCAVFAAALHLALGADPTDTFLAVREFQVGSRTVDSIVHIALQHKGEYYDSEGQTDPDTLLETWGENIGDRFDPEYTYDLKMYSVRKASYLVNRTGARTTMTDMVRSIQEAATRLGLKRCK